MSSANETMETLVRDLGHTPLGVTQALLYEYALGFQTTENPDKLVDLYVQLILSTRDLPTTTTTTTTPTPPIVAKEGVSNNEEKAPEQTTQDSSDDNAVVIAASNALSILNYVHLCGIQRLQSLWTHRDWSRIRVPYAILNLSVWIGCNLDYADLSQASLYRATFHECSFKHANLRHAVTYEGAEFSGGGNHFEETEDSTGLNFGATFAPDAKHFAVAASTSRPASRVALDSVGHSARADDWVVQEQMLAAAFSPDSHLVAMGSATGSIYIWDVATRALCASVKASELGIVALAWSQDGMCLASASQHPENDYTAGSAPTVQVWDMSVLDNRRVVSSKVFSCCGMAFSPDKSKLAVVEYAGRRVYATVEIWALSEGAELRCISSFYCCEAPTRVSFSHDGSLLAGISNGGGRIFIWDVSMGEPVLDEEVEAIEVHGQRFRRKYDLDSILPAFQLISNNPNTAYDADASVPEQVEILDKLTKYGFDGKNLLPPLRLVYPVMGDVDSVDKWERFVAFSPDGRYALRVKQGELCLRVCDLEILPWLATLQWHLECQSKQSASSTAQTPDVPDVPRKFVLSVDGGRVFSPTDVGIVAWDPTTSRPSGVLSYEQRFRTTIFDVTVSPDGGLLAAISENTVFLWDLTSNTLKLRRHLPLIRGLQVVCIAPDNSKIAVAGVDPFRNGHVYLVPVEAGNVPLEGEAQEEQDEQAAELEIRSSEQYFLAFSPNSQNLAVKGSQGPADAHLSVDVLELSSSTHTTLCSLDSSDEAFSDCLACGTITYSPNGESILMAGPANYVTVWNVARKEVETRLEGHASAVSQAAYAQDAEFIISADTCSVRFWHTASRSCAQVIRCVGLMAHFALSANASVLGASTREPDLHCIWKVDLSRDNRETEAKAREGEAGQGLEGLPRVSSHHAQLVRMSSRRSTWLVIRACDFENASVSSDLIGYTKPEA